MSSKRNVRARGGGSSDEDDGPPTAVVKRAGVGAPSRSAVTSAAAASKQRSVVSAFAEEETDGATARLRAAPLRLGAAPLTVPSSSQSTASNYTSEYLQELCAQQTYRLPQRSTAAVTEGIVDGEMVDVGAGTSNYGTESATLTKCADENDESGGAEEQALRERVHAARIQRQQVRSRVAMGVPRAPDEDEVTAAVPGARAAAATAAATSKPRAGEYIPLASALDGVSRVPLAAATTSRGPVASVEANTALDQVLVELSSASISARSDASAAARELDSTIAELTAAEAAVQDLQKRLASASATFDFYAPLHAFLLGYLKAMRPVERRLAAWEAAEAESAAASHGYRVWRQYQDVVDCVADAISAGLRLVTYGTPHAPSTDTASASSAAVDSGYAALRHRSTEARRLARRSRQAKAAPAVSAVQAYLSSSDASVPPLQVILNVDVADVSDDEDAHVSAAARELGTVRQAIVGTRTPRKYASTVAVLDKFAAWKADAVFSKTYVDSFAYLSLLELVMPIARVETTQWRPEPATTAPTTPAAPSDGFSSAIELLPWFSAAWQYSEAPIVAATGAASGDAAEAAQSDAQLVPALVARTVLPRLTAWINNVYNPHSSASTAACIATVQDVLVFEPEASQVQELASAVVAKLQSAAHQLALPVLIHDSTHHFSEDTLYYAVKLLATVHNMCSWSFLLAPAALHACIAEPIVRRLWVPLVEAGTHGPGGPAHPTQLPSAHSLRLLLLASIPTGLQQAVLGDGLLALLQVAPTR